MGLRETLESATPEWIAGSRYPECLSLWNGQHGKHVRMPSAADAQLAALAPELAALLLDMGEFIRNVCDTTNEWESSLLARLDQLGKEPDGANTEGGEA